MAYTVEAHSSFHSVKKVGDGIVVDQSWLASGIFLGFLNERITNTHLYSETDRSIGSVKRLVQEH